MITNSKDLLSALQNPPNGSEILLGPGLYMVTPPTPATDPAPVLWAWKGRIGIRVRGAGISHTRINTSCSGGLFELRDCLDITFEDIQFVGDEMNEGQPSTAYYSAITLESVNYRIHFRRCAFRDWGDQAIGHLHDGWDEDCLVEDCYFRNIGNLVHPNLTGDGAGVAWHGKNNRVIRSHFVECLRGVELEDKYGDAETCGNIVDQCCFENTIWQGVLLCPTHGQSQLFHDNRVTNNTFRHPAGSRMNYADRGIYVQGGNRVLIANNQIESDTLCPVVVELICPADGLTITGNELRSHKSNGIDVNKDRPFMLRNMVVTNNVIGPCGGRGAYLKADGLTVMGNTFGERGKQPNGQQWEAYVIDPESKRVLVTMNHDSTLAMPVPATPQWP